MVQAPRPTDTWSDLEGQACAIVVAAGVYDWRYPITEYLWVRMSFHSGRSNLERDSTDSSELDRLRVKFSLFQSIETDHSREYQ